jgi:hypothetical protein
MLREGAFVGGLDAGTLPHGRTPEEDGGIGHRLASNFLALLVC